MSQQVRVERKLVFDGAAEYTANVAGNFMPSKHWLYDDFDRAAVDETNDWLANEDHGGTSAINAAKNGTYRLTTSTTDNDKMELANSLVWYPNCNCGMEARIKVDAITTVKINVGFSDVAEEADNLTAFAIVDDTVTATADDAVCFVFDTDATADYWHCCNAIAGAETKASIAIAPVAATYEIFRILLKMSDDGTTCAATFYRNGVVVGHKDTAITITDALTPYIAVQSLAGTAARNLDVDYIYCWQDRG